MTPNATEVYLKEYEQALGTYRFTYQTIWQAGSIFISASAAVAAIAATRRGGVDPAVLACAPLPFLFWWLGVFRPMNWYGEIHSTRAAELEVILNARVPELRMNHFTTFDLIRKKDKGLRLRLKRVVYRRKPRVSEVVNSAGVLLLAAEAALFVNYIT
jgi:hypothetical protein